MWRSHEHNTGQDKTTPIVRSRLYTAFPTDFLTEINAHGQWVVTTRIHRNFWLIDISKRRRKK